MEFAKKEGHSTLSKLIRKAVNFYIDSFYKISIIENFPNIAQNLRKDLTSIKGFSQLILEDNLTKLDEDCLIKIREIFNSCLSLEAQIKEIFDEIDEKKFDKVDILIIDDDYASNMILSEWFKRKGFNTIHVKSGTEGLRILKKVKPKFIFLDIVLSNDDIFKIYNEIKSNCPESTKIFFLSALSEKEMKRIIKKTQVDGYILKPFNFSNFDNFLDVSK